MEQFLALRGARGAFSPEQLRVLQEVFDRLRAEWKVVAHPDQEALADSIVRAAQEGDISDVETLIGRVRRR